MVADRSEPTDPLAVSRPSPLGLQTRSPRSAEPRAWGVQNQEQGADPPVWVSSVAPGVCRPRKEKKKLKKNENKDNN